MINHTKGPWSKTDNSWDVSTVYGADGEVVAECPIYGDTTEDTQAEHEAIKEANALLIAAAPDLLKALSRIAVMMDNEMAYAKETAAVAIARIRQAQ